MYPGMLKSITVIVTKQAPRQVSVKRGNCFVNSAPAGYLAGPRWRQDARGLHLPQAPVLSLPGLIPRLSPSPSWLREAEQTLLQGVQAGDVGMNPTLEPAWGPQRSSSWQQF